MTVEIDKFIQMPTEQNGQKKLRILPPLKGNKLFTATRIHSFGMVGSSGGFISFHCHKELINGKWVGGCLACDKYNEFWKYSETQQIPYYYKGSQRDFEADLRRIKPNERFYYNVIDRDNDEKPLIFSCSKLVHGIFIKAIIGDHLAQQSALGDITHPKTGRDFLLVKQTKHTDSATFPIYDKSHFLEPSVSGTKEQIENWSQNLHDLSQCRTLKPEQEMREALKFIFGDWDIPEKKKFKKQKEVVRDINEPFESSFHA